MSETDLDPGHGIETCITKSFHAVRREWQKTQVFTAIKMDLRSITKDASVLELPETCVPRYNITASEVSLLATLYVTRMLEAGAKLIQLEQTFFNRCLCTATNIGIPQQCIIRNPEWVTTMHEVIKLLPADC